MYQNTGVIQGSTLCFKDGLQLPPLDFTTTCTKSGRYVIFYNERLDGITYPEGYEIANVITELCEVEVQGTYTKRHTFYNLKWANSTKKNNNNKKGLDA